MVLPRRRAVELGCYLLGVLLLANAGVLYVDEQDCTPYWVESVTVDAANGPVTPYEDLSAPRQDLFARTLEADTVPASETTATRFDGTYVAYENRVYRVDAGHQECGGLASDLRWGQFALGGLLVVALGGLSRPEG
jgi:hypothetical protein